MRHIVLTSLATLIATVLLAGAAVAASPGASLNKGKTGPSAGAMRPGITQPSAPFRPSPIATNPNLPRPGAGLPTIPPGRIGPINPPVANPPVANPPGFTPPPSGGLPNPCTANPGLCRINPPVAGPPNLNPPVDGGIPNLCRINPRVCQPPGINPPGINPPGGSPPGNNPPGNNPPGNPPPVGDNNPPGGGGGGGHGHHHHHPFPYFGIGLAAGLAAPTVVEYVTQPVAVAPAEAQPVAPAAPVAAVASPFDDFLVRLNGLDRAMEQRLITKEEYRSQREAILASLDAGQVSRSIGMQAGLQWLKSLAEAGRLSPKEYDTKRKEFVLFL